MQNITLFGMTLFDMFYFFIFYSVLGWFIEVCFMTLETGEFENRGFLNGPYCPIYGFGVVLILICLRPFMESYLTLFVSSLILCTSLELFVGVLLEKLFKNKWWDYSDYPFNFKGYICLKISICWGLGCVFVLKVFHPLLAAAVSFIPYLVGNIIIILIFVLIVFDIISAVFTVKSLNLRIRQIAELGIKLRQQSESVGRPVSDEVVEIKHKYDRLVKQRKYAQDRLIKAFPGVKSTKYNEALEKLKVHVINSKFKSKKQKDSNCDNSSKNN